MAKSTKMQVRMIYCGKSQQCKWYTVYPPRAAPLTSGYLSRPAKKCPPPPQSPRPLEITSEEQHLSRTSKIYAAAWCCSTEVRQYSYANNYMICISISISLFWSKENKTHWNIPCMISIGWCINKQWDRHTLCCPILRVHLIDANSFVPEIMVYVMLTNVEQLLRKRKLWLASCKTIASTFIFITSYKSIAPGLQDELCIYIADVNRSIDTQCSTTRTSHINNVVNDAEVYLRVCVIKWLYGQFIDNLGFCNK